MDVGGPQTDPPTVADVHSGQEWLDLTSMLSETTPGDPTVVMHETQVVLDQRDPGRLRHNDRCEHPTLA
jgi:hypothetical protein